MKVNKLILLILFAIVALKFFTGFPLDNTSFPGGTDVAHFFTNTWYIDAYGVTKWNYWWYGGFPFLKFYPPIAFLLTAFVGKALGALVAYKFVNNLFLALDVLAFYFFVREFKLSKEKEIVSTIIFAFIPIFAYFFVDGRFPTLINVFFALLYWKFLKRSLDSRRFTDISIAALFISISLLTHHTTTFLFIAISSAWAIIYKPKLETMKKLLIIGIMTLAITAWWSFPFLIETSGSSLGSGSLFSRAVGSVYVGDLVYRIKTSVLSSPYYASNFEPYILIGLATSILAASLLSLTKYKDKTTRDFILLSVFIVAMLLVVRYERSVIFLSVPVAIIIAEGLAVIKGNMRLVVEIGFILLIATSYFLIRPQMNEISKYPDIPKDSRVVFFPIGAAYVSSSQDMKNFYDVIFSPMNGREDIRGWHDESQLVGANAANKVSYLNNVSDPLHTNINNYYDLLRAGFINYVVVNRNDTEIVNYFSKSTMTEIYSDNMFLAYELNPKSSYIELNGKSVAANITKDTDQIKISTDCQKGIVNVKESYNSLWKVSINNQPTKTSFNQYGFMQFNSGSNGPCEINMSFESPWFYSIFYFVTLGTIVFILISIFSKKVNWD